MVNKIFNQQYTPNFKKNINSNNNKINTNINTMNMNFIKNNQNINNLENLDQIEELKIKPTGWNKESTSYNINKALQENKGKKEYTAHTYSTIQKIKNINQKKKVKSKNIIFLLF